MQTVLLTIILLLVCLSTMVFTRDSKFCEDRKSCDSCIAYGCTWCKEISFGLYQRCNTPEGHKINKCPSGHIVEAKPAQSNITKREQISKSMRITPQEIDIQLAVGKEASPIYLTYNDSTDRALDLYYIMDLSATMEDDKKTVSQQAGTLVQKLREITKDVQLGFGAFIDKPVLPFVASSQLRPDAKYAIPYGFRNWLKLTNDSDKFRAQARDAQISRNLDEPEGTLDALMQAITCTDEIGWRNTSRKLIVVATDGPFHVAGDGKLGGIVRPNDMKCHMKDGQYTHSTLIDYPSIGEINAVILQHKVYVIFAVSSQDNHILGVYKELQKHITQSVTEELTTDSSNVVEIIRSKYKEISGRVDLTVEEKPNHVDVEISAKCSTKANYAPQSYCTNVGVGERIDFKITLKLRECPDPRRNTQNRVVISSFVLSSKEKLIINLSYACTCTSCNQETNTSPEDLRKYCSGAEATRHISCGSCYCNEGRFGDRCQCSVDGENENVDNKNCVHPNGNSTCSNKGECKCGRCDCVRGYNGKYCEETTFSCQDPKGNPDRLCSDKGECVKGKCECQPGYNGKFCECEESKKELCIEPGKSVHCNGHGTCDCRQTKCKCDSGYVGLYCGICKSNCPTNEMSGSRCQDEFLQKCVRCRVQKLLNSDKKLEQQCNELCDPKRYNARKTTSPSSRPEVSSLEFVEKLTLASLSDEVGTECRDLKVNATPCYTDFKYAYQRAPQVNDVLQVYYTSDGLRCEREPPFLWYIFGVILAVLLAGILGLLIWKLATHFHDTREFQRFEKETKGAKWGGGENPIYSKPMSEFQNPAYRE